MGKRDGIITPAIAPAVRAAQSVAAEFGVPGTPELLWDGSNVLVHLAPTPVVARVATTTGLVRADVGGVLGKDLAIAGYLACQGAPVVAPSAELPPGPHHRDGYAIAFWTYQPHEPERQFAPERVGPELARLHAALRDYPGELPSAPPLDLTGALAYLRAHADRLATPAEFDRLAEQGEALLAELADRDEPAVPLHGDAHPGNLLYTEAGPVWTDFEDAWRGPIGWDLACLTLTGRMDGRAAVACYPDGPTELAPYLRARRLQAVLWGMVFATRFPERRAEARTTLTNWLTAP